MIESEKGLCQRKNKEKGAKRWSVCSNCTGCMMGLQGVAVLDQRPRNPEKWEKEGEVGPGEFAIHPGKVMGATRQVAMGAS